MNRQTFTRFDKFDFDMKYSDGELSLYLMVQNRT